MGERIQKMKKNQSGFTLVELIVVLVILAILIALLVPALTGYIDKSKKRAAKIECRHVVQAAQTSLSEEYGDMVFTIGIEPDGTTTSETIENILKLSDVDGTVEAVRRTGGTIVFVQYKTKDGKYTVIYDKNYKAHGRSALYTMEEGGSGDGSTETGEKTSKQVLDDLFGDWTQLNSNVSYVTFTAGGVDYAIGFTKDGYSVAAGKDDIKEATGIKRENIACQSGDVSPADKFSRALTAYIAEHSTDKKEVDEVTIHSDGSYTVVWK